MDHTTDEQLQSYVDREGSEDERETVIRHIEACAPCHDRLEALEALAAEVSGAVALLSRPPVPRPAFAVLEARARVDRSANGRAANARRANARTAPRGETFTSMSAAWAGPWLRAAAIVLALAGVAGAATIFVQRGADDGAAPASPQQQERTASSAPAAAQMARSGVSVVPSAGRIVVAVRGAAAGTTIDVGVEDAGTASAFVRGDGEGIRFSAQAGRIDVDVTDRAIAIDVQLPAGATNATVEVDGRVRARKIAGRVRVERGDTDVVVRALTERGNR